MHVWVGMGVVGMGVVGHRGFVGESLLGKVRVVRERLEGDQRNHHDVVVQ